MPKLNLLLAAALLTAASSSAADFSWSTGTAGDASGAWGATNFNGQTYDGTSNLTIDGAGTATKTITTSGTITTPASLTVSATGSANTTTFGAAGVGAVTLTGTAIGGSLAKTGTADLVLASTNGFTSSSISSGKFFLSASNALGTGTLTVGTGTITKTTSGSVTAAIASQFFFDTSAQATSLSFANNIAFGTPASATTYGFLMKFGSFSDTLSGNLTGGSNATLWFDVSSSSNPPPATWILSGNNTGFTGTIRLNRGNIQFNSVEALGGAGAALFIQTNGSGVGTPAQGNLTFNFSGGETTSTISNAITLQNNGGTAAYLDTQANIITLSSTFSSGLGSFGKMGTGTLILTNATNAVTVATTIANGTLSVAGAGRYNSGSYAQALTLTAATSVFNYASSANQTLSGVISGSGLITKSGTSALTLSATNTFAGGITVSGGSLITGNTSALGTGAVSITAGSLQVGTTTANNTVTLGSGASLAIANGASLKLGALNAASLDATIGTNGVITLAGGGTYTFNGTGAIDLGGVLNGLSAGVHTYNLIIGGTGTDSVSFTGFDSTVTGLSMSSGVLSFTAVPEPSTYGLLGAASLAGIAFVRRRRVK